MASHQHPDHHPITPVAGVDGEHMCSCGDSFTSRVDLAAHTQRWHDRPTWPVMQEPLDDLEPEIGLPYHDTTAEKYGKR